MQPLQRSPSIITQDGPTTVPSKRSHLHADISIAPTCVFILPCTVWLKEPLAPAPSSTMPACTEGGEPLTSLLAW